MRRAHAMPFGTEVRPQGGVRFRLWAPACCRVALVLEDPPFPEVFPMHPVPGGWYELGCEDARIDSLYRFEVDGGIRVPDPASRANPRGVHGPSRVCDPLAFSWPDSSWQGRPWEEAVVYELHVGAFSPEGSFAGVEARLDHLVELGITAVELMPVGSFPGRRNWGYDGVLPFAPHAGYGSPEDLKRLVAAAHRRGLMMLLDVVCNHFGPEGNYLPCYAPAFFSPDRPTPWGPAINFDGPGSRTVRDYFLHLALYWLEEFRFDGLRLDAVHAIQDDSSPHFLEELVAAVRSGPGGERPVHLVLENDRNDAGRLARRPGEPHRATAQWNDDFHHALHVLLTGERHAYYADYAEDPARHLGRCLAEGFSFQGEPSGFRGGAPRGEPSRELPPRAFVNFLQTHDQVGNRVFGERLGDLAAPEALRAAMAILLLAPSPPLLFMGEEFGAPSPFLFFCDFQSPLAEAVREGRRREFPALAGECPDPNAEATFERSRLDWGCLALPTHGAWLGGHRRLLGLRRDRLAPRLAGIPLGAAFSRRVGRAGLACSWRLGDGSRLSLLANLGPEAASGFSLPTGMVLFAEPEAAIGEPFDGRLPPWAVAWFLEPGGGP